MIHVISDNIISPLGVTSEGNYASVKAGVSKLKCYSDKWNIPEAFVASLIERPTVEEMFTRLSEKTDYTFFEKLGITSISSALEKCDIDATSERVIFVISSTKGNVDLLDVQNDSADERVFLGVTAERIARFFRNPNVPIVVSNACISGVCAQITAQRLLESERYDYAVVLGIDCQSKFIISGFQSFKALSESECKPFDTLRTGLNLGEAAATIIFSRMSNDGAVWHLIKGAIRNDANHISGPSRTGEGSYRALKVLNAPSDIAFINVHGTATPYNDEMESIAIDRAGLSEIPVNALKGFYGHTMGAAGVLETIISMKAIDDNTILGTRGYSEHGVSRRLNISSQNRFTDKNSFIKLLSGFGGCNAALLMQKGVGTL